MKEFNWVIKKWYGKENTALKGFGKKGLEPRINKEKENYL